MPTRPTLTPVAVALAILGPPAGGSSNPLGWDADIARGVVYEDRDADGQRDEGEPPIPGVGVSNGIDIVRTDDAGRYELPMTRFGVVFVVKPTGYAVPVDAEQGLPRFFYLHRPTGSPAWLGYPGVGATGPLPASIDFPLMPRDEPDRFRILAFGDPQPRNLLEVDYLRRDVIEPMIDSGAADGAAFGVSLGDIAFDHLFTFTHQNRQIARLGIPWYNIIGNHDINTDAQTVADADVWDDETFERIYGPPTHAFFHGGVLFIALDNIFSRGPADGGGWTRRFGDDRIAFARNAVALAPPGTLVVGMAHAPIHAGDDVPALLAALRGPADRPPHRVLFLTAHYHRQFQEFFGEDRGWSGDEPLHHVVVGTACGSWWGGRRDERGIPEATMADGTPNGFMTIHFDGGRYRLAYTGAPPAPRHMRIESPATVAPDRLADTPVRANIFLGSERSTVRLALVPEAELGTADADPDDLPDAVLDAFDAGPLEPGPSNRHAWSGFIRPQGRVTPGRYRLVVRCEDPFAGALRGSVPIELTPPAGGEAGR